MKGKFTQFVLGVFTGAILFGGAAAAAAGIAAEPSWSPIYVNGQQVSMTAYNIGGSNYVRLRDIGKAAGFNVYYLDGVQVDTASPYTGVAPVQETVPSTAPTDDVEAMRQEIVERTNAIRRENGLPALSIDPMLMRAAQVRADEMAAATVYSHTRPDGRKYNTVTDCTYVAENIHRISLWRLEEDQTELAQTAVEEWAASEGHLQNILRERAASIGVGLARGVNSSGFECWYCVQEFLYKGYTITWVDSIAK